MQLATKSIAFISVLIILISPVSGLEFTDQPPSVLSLSPASEYQITYKVDNTIKEAKFFGTFLYNSDGTDSPLVQCNPQNWDDLYRDEPYFIPIRDELVSENMVQFQIGDLGEGGTFSISDIDEDYRFTASNDNLYACFGMMVEVTDGAGNSIISDTKVIKLYETTAEIPDNERVMNIARNYTMIIVSAGLFFAFFLFAILIEKYN